MRVILEHSRIKPYIAGIAHDGSQRILSVQQLPQPLEIDVDFQYRQDADPVVITVDIILVHKLNTKVLREYVAGNPQHRGHNIHPMLSALSIIIKQHATRNAGPPTRKQPDTWYNETRREPAGPFIEALVGVSFSIYPTLGYLNLNIGPQKSLFHCPGNLADMMLANRQESTTMFKWLRILANRPGMDPSSIIVTRVANATARQSPMIDSNMTVEDYFRTNYNVTLQHSNDIPVIEFGKGIPFPAELCDVLPGQLVRRRLPYGLPVFQKWSSKSPLDTASVIHAEGLRLFTMQRSSALPDLLDRFRITIDLRTNTIPARVLPAPGIIYGNGIRVVRDGLWNVKDTRTLSGATVSNWAVLLVQGGSPSRFTGIDDPNFRGFVSQFVQKCRAFSMKIPDRPFVMQVSVEREDADVMARVQEIIISRLRFRPSLLIVMLPWRKRQLYAAIKYYTDVVLGIHTAHILLPKAHGDGYLSSLALKLNAKLGGVNYYLDDQSIRWLSDRADMIVGLHVRHSPPSTEMVWTTAAMVSNVDGFFHNFPARLKVAVEFQKPDVGRLFGQCLALYRSKNGRLPERILIYRSGALPHNLLCEEVPQISSAYFKAQGRLGDPAHLKLSIVHCCKSRNHPWIFVDQDKSRSGNAPSGTVVDKGISQPFSYDFYLQVCYSDRVGQVVAESTCEGWTKGLSAITLYSGLRHQRVQP